MPVPAICTIGSDEAKFFFFPRSCWRVLDSVEKKRGTERADIEREARHASPDEGRADGGTSRMRKCFKKNIHVNNGSLDQRKYHKLEKDVLPLFGGVCYAALPCLSAVVGVGAQQRSPLNWKHFQADAQFRVAKTCVSVFLLS